MSGRSGPGAKLAISTGGGSSPTWSRTKQRVVLRPQRQIMVAPYAVEGDSFRAEKPRLWSEGRFQPRGPNRMFDLHPDGERFALAPSRRRLAARSGTRSSLIFNFFDELRRIAPATTR